MTIAEPKDSSPEWTIVDVLENALDGDLSAGRAEALTAAEVKNLREVVLEFYDAWAPYPAGEDMLRVHLGGWVAASAGDGLPRDLLHSALLYAHQVVVYDPVAAFFEPRRGRLRTFDPVKGVGISSEASAVHIESTGGYEAHPEELDGHRSALATAIPAVASLAPLIRSGTVVPIPHLKLVLERQEKIWVAIRHMLADDDYCTLLDRPVDLPALTQDEGMSAQLLVTPRTAHDARVQQYGDAAHYLSRSVALADAAYASYMPPSGTEWAIYLQRLERLGPQLAARERLDLTVAPALVRSELPYFRNLSTPDVLGVRENDEHFDHWRRSLRRATRQVTALPSEGEEFEAQAREVLGDELTEAAAEVRAATSRSAALKRSLRPSALTIGTGAAGTGGTAALELGSAAGLVGVGLTGMLGWLAHSLLPPNLTGTKAVLAHLSLDPQEELNAEEWPKREGLVLSPKK